MNKYNESQNVLVDLEKKYIENKEALLTSLNVAMVLISFFYYYLLNVFFYLRNFQKIWI